MTDCHHFPTFQPLIRSCNCIAILNSPDFDGEEDCTDFTCFINTTEASVALALTDSFVRGLTFFLAVAGFNDAVLVTEGFTESCVFCEVVGGCSRSLERLLASPPSPPTSVAARLRRSRFMTDVVIRSSLTGAMGLRSWEFARWRFVHAVVGAA